MKTKLLLPILIFALAVAGCGDGNDTKIPVTGVTLDKSTIELVIGETETLTATVAPANATNKGVAWISDAPAVATVNGTTGEVTAVGPGTATITATTVDGAKTATCTVMVSPTGLLYLDTDGKLAVGLNVPVSKMVLFKFGSVVGMSVGTNDEEWKTDGSQIVFNPMTTPGNAVGDYHKVPLVDSITVANVAAGIGDPCRLAGLTIAEIKGGKTDNGKWRLPTDSENAGFTESNSVWKDAAGSPTGEAGRLFTFTGYSIFLPAAGFRSNTSGTTDYVGSTGYYWSSVPDSSSSGYCLCFGSDFMNSRDGVYCAIGFAVRCVRQ